MSRFICRYILRIKNIKAQLRTICKNQSLESWFLWILEAGPTKVEESIKNHLSLICAWSLRIMRLKKNYVILIKKTGYNEETH